MSNEEKFDHCKANYSDIITKITDNLNKEKRKSILPTKEEHHISSSDLLYVDPQKGKSAVLFGVNNDYEYETVEKKIYVPFGNKDIVINKPIGNYPEGEPDLSIFDHSFKIGGQ
jgi:hypothetical protein